LSASFPASHPAAINSCLIIGIPSGTSRAANPKSLPQRPGCPSVLTAAASWLQTLAGLFADGTCASSGCFAWMTVGPCLVGPGNPAGCPQEPCGANRPSTAFCGTSAPQGSAPDFGGCAFQRTLGQIRRKDPGNPAEQIGLS
jgi:hypothetical protein